MFSIENGQGRRKKWGQVVFNSFLTLLLIFTLRKGEGKEDWKGVKGGKERTLFCCFLSNFGAGKLLSVFLLAFIFNYLLLVFLSRIFPCHRYSLS